MPAPCFSPLIAVLSWVRPLTVIPLLSWVRMLRLWSLLCPRSECSDCDHSFALQALLGTYQCTEVPGQFVWRPGVLTEAVTKGYWVLLEDLDHAPMEVVSTLAPLLQTSTLAVPGHGDIIHAAPGFQLFATQR